MTGNEIDDVKTGSGPADTPAPGQESTVDEATGGSHDDSSRSEGVPVDGAITADVPTWVVAAAGITGEHRVDGEDSITGQDRAVGMGAGGFDRSDDDSVDDGSVDDGSVDDGSVDDGADRSAESGDCGPGEVDVHPDDDALGSTGPALADPQSPHVGPVSAAGAPSVLIPIAPGTNRNDDMALAFELAGAVVRQYPLEAIRRGETRLADHQILAIPGGFSYGDALGAGRVLGLELDSWFRDQLEEARAREMPIIGVCNGFQALVHAGLLPGGETSGALVANASGRFECRWVHLQPGAGHSVWTAGLTEPLWCPIAHGEGRYVSDNGPLLLEDDLVAFRYADADGTPADKRYPLNPNGSANDVAGVCDPTGLILGMMPHPENHVLERQTPDRRRPDVGRCLPLFAAGVAAVAA